MTQPDLITIGITCYNAAETIARAITSALAQDWPNIEIIVVDDCSTDNSVSVVQQHDVTLIRHEHNQGPAAARQSILDAANGEFVVFFDDDDESLPQRLRVQHDRIVSYENETAENLIACYASGKRLYDNGYELKLEAIGSQPEVPWGNAAANRLLFFDQTPGLFFGSGTPSCALMARKTTFDAVDGFDAAFRRVEDIDFAVRLALAGGHFIGCPEELFVQHSTQGSDKAPDNNLKAEQQLADKHKEYLLSVGRYEYAKNWPLLRYHHFRKEHGKMLKVLARLFLKYPAKTTCHFLNTAPRRFLHERKMNREAA